MAFPSMVIPKEIDRCIITLYLDMDWTTSTQADIKRQQWVSSLKSFTNVIFGKTGVMIPINHIDFGQSFICDDYINGQFVINITSIVKAGNDERFKDAVKEYMRLIIPALDCTDATFSITKEMMYCYNDCK